MKLEEIKLWFSDNGVACSWLVQSLGKKRYYQKLRPPSDQLIDIAPLEAAIVLPDMHLGWGNDIFRYNDPDRARRLEHFLDVLLALRAAVGNQLEVVQLGDWYDFWRSPALTPEQSKAAIEAQYPGVVARAAKLGVRHCIGNHDAALVEPALRRGLDEQIVRTLGTAHRVLCMHGHDAKTLESIAVDGETCGLGLNICSLLSSAPIVGPLGALVQRLCDGSSREPWSSSALSKPWPEAKLRGPAGWAAPWVTRDMAVQLGEAIAGIERCMGREMQAVFVAHTHRPGISWSPVATRRVPLIDVGSWTYGRAEFAVVCPDGVGLARLD
jgi:hypothetical protein